MPWLKSLVTNSFPNFGLSESVVEDRRGPYGMGNTIESMLEFLKESYASGKISIEQLEQDVERVLRPSQPSPFPIPFMERRLT